MSEALQQRIIALEARVKTLEEVGRASSARDGDRYTEILVRISRLETRVGFLAAGIGSVTGIASGLVSSIIVAIAPRLLGG